MRYFTFLIFFPVLVHAETSRTSTWLMSLSRIKFTDTVNAFVDIQPRFTLNDTPSGHENTLDTLLIRGALGYQLTPNIGVYQGYAYIPTYDPKNVEHRLFQELFINQSFNNGNAFTNRIRLEQRWIDSADEIAYRFRYFARYTHPLSRWHEKLSLAINEEIFINLNDAKNGPQSSFNQNRLFVGLNYRINPSVAYEFGYQNQYVNVIKNTNVMNHILFLGVQTNF
ncbi:MAG: DUF2490 domain-containing protein [Methylophilaceae bacterium]|nr:DUF2490 domain-containing protein [Methylophilaceae bacterium]